MYSVVDKSKKKSRTNVLEPGERSPGHIEDENIRAEMQTQDDVVYDEPDVTALKSAYALQRRASDTAPTLEPADTMVYDEPQATVEWSTHSPGVGASTPAHEPEERVSSPSDAQATAVHDSRLNQHAVHKQYEDVVPLTLQVDKVWLLPLERLEKGEGGGSILFRAVNFSDRTLF